MSLSSIRVRALRRLARPVLLGAGIGLFAASAPPRAAGQGADRFAVQSELFVGSELEEYLRLLQTLGKVPNYSWSIRGFGLPEVARLAPADSGHPWAARYDLAPAASRGLRLGLVRPRVDLVYNSALPYGYNDGGTWAGRGITTAATVGFSAQYGPVSLVVAPEIFRAQNQEFDIVTGARTGDAQFADPVSPTSIDLPQRFGDGSYGRVGPGQSSLRLDLVGLTAGVSTANQQWGPAWDQPLILGNNAEGFLHAFAGTARPLNIWIGRLHGRVVWGTLEQSSYAPSGSASGRRLMTGLVAAFQPRGAEGLEIGGTRFFHGVWPEGGPSLDDLLWPFQSLLKEGLADDDAPDGSDPDNQLASLFARWVLPRGGAEIYAEYAREDHNWNLRDLALEPDHDSGYVLGLSKAWTPANDRILLLRGEILNTRVSHLDRVRPQTPLYRHSRMRQGHTHLGQILGASSGYGGSHARLALDLYHPGGRWGAALIRSRRLVPVPPGSVSSTPGQDQDVMYSAELGGRFFLGRFELDAALVPGYEFNRNLQGDEFNLNLRLQATAGLW